MQQPQKEMSLSFLSFVSFSQHQNVAYTSEMC